MLTAVFSSLTFVNVWNSTV